MATFNCQSLRGWPSTVFSCVGDGQAGSLDGQRRSSAFVTQPGRNMASIFHLCGNVQLDEGQAVIFWVFEVSYILFSPPGVQLHRWHRYGLFCSSTSWARKPYRTFYIILPGSEEIIGVTSGWYRWYRWHRWLLCWPSSKDGARKAVLASSNRRMAAGTLGKNHAAMPWGCHGTVHSEHQLGLFDDCNIL